MEDVFIDRRYKLENDFACYFKKKKESKGIGSLFGKYNKRFMNMQFDTLKFWYASSPTADGRTVIQFKVINP